MPGLIGYWKQLPTKDEYIKNTTVAKYPATVVVTRNSAMLV